MSEQFTLKLNSPITEEQWDEITDVDFDHTEEIFFHTKHGKEVTFVKQKKGKWKVVDAEEPRRYGCSQCKRLSFYAHIFCPCCGARMEGIDETD